MVAIGARAMSTNGQVRAARHRIRRSSGGQTTLERIGSECDFHDRLVETDIDIARRETKYILRIISV